MEFGQLLEDDAEIEEDLESGRGQSERGNDKGLVEIQFEHYLPLRFQFFSPAENRLELRESSFLYVKEIFTRREGSEKWLRADLGVEYQPNSPHKLISYNGRRPRQKAWLDEFNKYISQPANFPLTLRLQGFDSFFEGLRQQYGKEILASFHFFDELGLDFICDHKMPGKLYDESALRLKPTHFYGIRVSMLRDPSLGFINQARLAGIQPGDWLMLVNGYPVLAGLRPLDQLKILAQFVRDPHNFPLTLVFKRCKGSHPLCLSELKDASNIISSQKNGYLTFYVFRTKKKSPTSRSEEYSTKVVTRHQLAKNDRCYDPAAEKVVVRALGLWGPMAGPNMQARARGRGEGRGWSATQAAALRGWAAAEAAALFEGALLARGRAYRHLRPRDWVREGLQPEEGPLSRRLDARLRAPGAQGGFLRRVCSETDGVDRRRDICFFVYRKRAKNQNNEFTAGFHTNDFINMEVIADPLAQRVLLKDFWPKYSNFGMLHVSGKAKELALNRIADFLVEWPEMQNVPSGDALFNQSFSFYLLHFLEHCFLAEGLGEDPWSPLFPHGSRGSGGGGQAPRSGPGVGGGGGCGCRAVCARCGRCVVHHCRCLLLSRKRQRLSCAKSSRDIENHRLLVGLNRQPVTNCSAQEHRQIDPSLAFLNSASKNAQCLPVPFGHHKDGSAIELDASHDDSDDDCCGEKPTIKSLVLLYLKDMQKKGLQQPPSPDQIVLDYVQQAAALRCAGRPALCRTLRPSALRLVAGTARRAARRQLARLLAALHKKNKNGTNQEAEASETLPSSSQKQRAVSVGEGGNGSVSNTKMESGGQGCCVRQGDGTAPRDVKTERNEEEASNDNEDQLASDVAAVLSACGPFDTLAKAEGTVNQALKAFYSESFVEAHTSLITEMSNDFVAGRRRSLKK